MLNRRGFLSFIGLGVAAVALPNLETGKSAAMGRAMPAMTPAPLGVEVFASSVNASALRGLMYYQADGCVGNYRGIQRAPYPGRIS